MLDLYIQNKNAIIGLESALRIALQGDINAVIGNLFKTIENVGGIDLKNKQSWLLDCKNKKEDWKAFKNERYNLHLMFYLY